MSSKTRLALRLPGQRIEGENPEIVKRACPRMLVNQGTAWARTLQQAL